MAKKRITPQVWELSDNDEKVRRIESCAVCFVIDGGEVLVNADALGVLVTPMGPRVLMSKPMSAVTTEFRFVKRT